MSNTHLVIVESPAKAKTIKKYLGKDFVVLASYGHVRDLLPKTGSVDPNNGFAMTYEAIDRNKRHVDTIIKALKSADSLYLATDPDREGEAIAWHIDQLLNEKKLLKGKAVYRVVFNEVTKTAVKHAVDNPRAISMDLVNAQQARRALDYLVGFTLSPLLWKKIRRGLSAGRVQSPALRLIVERELEIEAFKVQEYWSIQAISAAEKQQFPAKLIIYQNEKLEQFSITNTEKAEQVKENLLASAQGKLKVEKVDKKQRKRNPAPPFITSTLQQESVRKLGFSAKRAMMIAQQLYEGIDIGTGTVGLITYMRTDSFNLAGEAIAEIREFITKRYGADHVPASPREFKRKSKNAQEAHEAIRPTSVKLTPDLIKDSLNKEQYKLYELIWKRSVACQMIHATFDTVAIDLSCGEGNTFRANGSTLTSPGFIKVYQESSDEQVTDDGEDKLLPPLKEGQLVDLLEINANQHFTEPPPRYSEASLIKTLEEHGIGRPSTYAPIIQTLQQREYVLLETKRFYPTDVGRVVNRFLTEYFTQYVDYDFTAQLEDQLDEISRGEKEWVPLLEHFWKPFHERIETVNESVQRSDVTTEKLDKECPKCGKQLSIRLGKRGRFIGCTAYPDCDYTANLEGGEVVEPEIVADRKCPSCNNDLIIKTGRYGKFIGCSNYPECTHIEPLEKPSDTGVECPECHKGNILKRKSRRGKVFFSCSTYPDCEYALWNEPIDEACKKCSWPIMTTKTTKRRGTEKVCPHCKHSEKVEDESEAED